MKPVQVMLDEALLAEMTVMVAPITSTIRGLPSEGVVGVDEGLKHESAINLDHVQTVDQAALERCLVRLGPEKLNALCRALAVAVGCG
jgi:mRNA interferase MazF